MARARPHVKKQLRKDILLISASILGAVVLSQTSLLNILISKTPEFQLFGSFVAGMFFTSAFTTAPAAVALVQIAHSTPLLLMAMVGALGGVVGDLVLFYFLKDHLSTDVLSFMNASRRKKFLSVFKLRIFRRLTPLWGAIMIIGPFPDEIGLAMMGLSNTRPRVLIPISLTMNFISIVLLVLVADALL
jgi:hypothetical protein